MNDRDRDRFPKASDSGNAELFSELYGNRVRFNHTNGVWYIFDRVYWRGDDTMSVNELAKETARERQKRALSIHDTRKKEAEFRFGLKSENHSGITQMLKAAKSLEVIRTTHEDWDFTDTLFQCENALLNLDACKPVEILPVYMISQNSNVYYAPSEDCPIFKRCLLEWMNDDNEMVRFIQRVMGYCLTGLTSEQCLFWFVGDGANGKSVLIDVFDMLYGDYSKDTNMDAFMTKYNQTNTNDLARLHNARVVTANESAEGKRINEERIKLISGGEKVTARFLHREFFTFTSKIKLVFATNTLPRVKDFSEGFWRRVRIVNFDRYFPPEKRKPREELLGELKRELPGILNFALEGLKQYHKLGLKPPIKVIHATKEYRIEEDEVARWLQDCVDQAADNKITTKEAYQSFMNWFEENEGSNLKPISQSTFSRRMRGKGHPPEKVGSKKYFLGVKLSDDDETTF